MKIASWNVNGIRSIHGKGLLKWMEDLGADIVCLQEVKARSEQCDDELRHPLRYHGSWHSAEKAGYSGVATFSRREPLSVREGIACPDVDREGRVLTLEYPDFWMVNAYFPNSQRDHARLDYKLRFCRDILAYLDRLAEKKHVVVCGDFNIAHKEIDLRNPKQNLNNAGFLPGERQWMDELVTKGFVDAFRVFEKGGGHYTWWSYRPGVRQKNIGWRLDYFFVDPGLRDRLRKVSHQCEVPGSDHCPILLELKP